MFQFKFSVASILIAATIAQVFALPFPAEDDDPSRAVAYQEHHATGSTGAQVTTDTHHQPPLTVNPKE